MRVCRLELEYEGTRYAGVHALRQVAHLKSKLTGRAPDLTQSGLFLERVLYEGDPAPGPLHAPFPLTAD
jgi:hypothetical protein